MSEVLNVDSVKSPDKDAKSNGTGNAGDGRDQNPSANRAVDRRGRGEGFYSSENRSKQSSMRNDISYRDERNHSYSGRDGYRTKEKPRSSSRGNTNKVNNLSNSTTASNNSINDSSTGSNGSISSYSNRVRRAEEMDRRGQNSSINRPGRRTEDPMARSRMQGLPPQSNSSFDKKGK